MKPHYHAWASGLIISTMMTSVSSAAVTTVAYWRLGEDDAGAKAGQTINNTADHGGTFALTGAATYSSDVKSGSGSTLSAFFGGNGALSFTTPVTNVTDNFGVEAWVKCTDLSKNSTFVNNGNTGGYGLLLSGGALYTIFNGVAVLPGNWPPAGGYVPTTTEWVNVAVVRNNGVTTLYINGAAYGSTTLSVAPASPSKDASATFKIGSGFVGNIDEVRVFTFQSGQFQTSDLLVNVPEPSSLGIAATTGALLAVRMRSKK